MFEHVSRRDSVHVRLTCSFLTKSVFGRRHWPADEMKADCDASGEWKPSADAIFLLAHCNRLRDASVIAHFLFSTQLIIVWLTGVLLRRPDNQQTPLALLQSCRRRERWRLLWLIIQEHLQYLLPSFGRHRPFLFLTISK